MREQLIRKVFAQSKRVFLGKTHCERASKIGLMTSSITLKGIIPIYPKNVIVLIKHFGVGGKG